MNLIRLLEDDKPDCTYELLKAAADKCAYVKDACDESEAINLFHVRYCGLTNSFLFYALLVTFQNNTR